jgi:TldD protein
MIGLLLGIGALWAADPSALEAAVHTEIERAMNGLRLPEQPAPHHISVQIIDGQYATIFTQDGAITSANHGPHREARIDVRVGSDNMDSGNFNASLGNRNGTQMRGLHHEDVELATRRELWLALDDAYKGATEIYAAKQAARSERRNKFPPDLAKAPVVEIDFSEPPLPATAALFGRVKALTQEVGSDTHLENSAFIGHDWHGKRLVINTEGTRAWLPTDRVVIRGEVIGRANDGSRLRNTRSWVARSLEHMPNEERMRTELRAASQWVEALQEAPVERDYLGPVLFEAPAAAELFRQLLHPEISGSPPAEWAPDPMSEDAMPVPLARIGRRLLPAGWSVIDDPTADSHQASHYTHDHDAVAVQPVHLIEDGILRDVLMSRVPRMDRSKSTGHGRTTGSSRRTAMPGQVTVSPHKSTAEARMRKKALAAARSAGLKYVIVVRRITPPSLSEDFEFAVTGEGPLAGLTPPEEAYRLYADGREEPIRGLQFSGVDRRVLRDIIASGRTGQPVEMLDGSGTSERFTLGEAGGSPVSWSVPPVLISEMELRGNAGGEPRVIPRPKTD